jgi:hypothetical protein
MDRKSKMTESQRTAHAEEQRYEFTSEEEQERKARVLSHNEPALVRSIADAVVVKYEDLFFLTTRDGSVPLGGDHGFGLYYHDCRFLNGYELKLAERNPTCSSRRHGVASSPTSKLTNPDIRMANGQLISKQRRAGRARELLPPRPHSSQQPAVQGRGPPARHGHSGWVAPPR